MKLATKVFKRTDWYVTSNYGYRKDPLTGETRMHNGTDYGTHCKKWPQYAVEDGYVHIVHSTDNGGYGKYIWVRYPRLNISVLHAHMDSIKVKQGDKVNSKTLLGYTGKSGRVTGIHLHLGMKLIGSSKWLNPHTYEYTEPPKKEPKAEEPKVEPPKVEVKKTGLAVGDKVKIIKPGNGSSYGTSNTARGIGWTRYITAIYPGRAYPYQVGLAGRTNSLSTTGFYKAEALNKIN
jgi:murein DD-endopeptidase MepM/ murein hydrolase activator NlpD